jgi:hypothetical protein
VQGDAPGVMGTTAGLNQLDKDTAGQLPFRLGQLRPIFFLGIAGDGFLDLTNGFVAGVAQATTRALLPQLIQGKFQQGQLALGCTNDLLVS